jgi:hypothetical protein
VVAEGIGTTGAIPLATALRHHSSKETGAMRKTLLTALLIGSVACGDDSTDPSSIAGNYSATVFQVTLTGAQPIDVLAAGGSLTVTISDQNATTGTLSVPASLNGGTPFTATMTGTAVITGTTVRFEQTADTFVRDLNWTIAGTTLTTTNQTAGGASYTITLTRS